MESPLSESRESFCYPRPLSLSRGGKWRVLWDGDQPPPASFSPRSLELRNRPLVPACATVDRRVRGHSSKSRQRTSPSPDFQRGDTRTAAPRCQKAAPSCPPALPGWRLCERSGGGAVPGERDHKWGRPRLCVSGSDGRSPAITRPGMVPLDRKPRAGSQLRAKGEGCLSVTAQQPEGQPQSVGQWPHP